MEGLNKFMKQFVPIRDRLEKDVIVRINRILPGKGTINVSLGQEVEPSDIIGSANVTSGFRILNLAQLLGVKASDVEQYLKRDLGQRIYKGELLAYKDGGIFGDKKTVVAPTDGLLDYLNPESGEMKITLLPRKIDLPSGVYGIVDSIDKERGLIVIKAQASRVYGMFGCGKAKDGILEVLGERGDLVGEGMITSKSEGHILVGGSLIYKRALSVAISVGVAGIITGGINAKDYRSIAGGRLIFPKKLDNDIGVSVVVCEGFGSVPIGEDIYNELCLYNNKFVSIDGNAGVINLPSFQSSSLAKVKGTTLPPVEDILQLGIDKAIELKVGTAVRVVGNSYFGEQGKIVSVDEIPTLLPSGISAILATIETKRRKIKVPVVNLEAINYI